MYGGVNLECPFLCPTEDTPEHLLHCTTLLSKLEPCDRHEVSEVHYMVIFGSTLQQKKIVNMLSKLMEIRTKLLNKNI